MGGDWVACDLDWWGLQACACEGSICACLPACLNVSLADGIPLIPDLPPPACLNVSLTVTACLPLLLMSAGIRKARLSDVDAVQSLLQPLEKEGVLVKRSRNELEAMMHDFIVIERETKVGGGGRQCGS